MGNEAQRPVWLYRATELPAALPPARASWWSPDERDRGARDKGIEQKNKGMAGKGGREGGQGTKSGWK